MEGSTILHRALCPRKATVSGRNHPSQGTLSPNGNGFREEPSLAGLFVPEWQQFPGGTLPREALYPRMATVPGRKCPWGAEGDTFVPEWQQFPGETYPRGHFVPRRQQFPGGTIPRGALCPRMATVSGRKCPPGAERDTFVPRRHLFPGEMVLSSRR